jgi:hypothetical protein
MAFQLTGDLGGITYVQRAGYRRVGYAKTYPRRTPSALQKYRRDRFKAACDGYKRLDDEHKLTLNLIAEHYKLVMSGFNLYISCYLNNNTSTLQDWSADVGRSW